MNDGCKIVKIERSASRRCIFVVTSQLTEKIIYKRPKKTQQMSNISMVIMYIKFCVYSSIVRRGLELNKWFTV